MPRFLLLLMFSFFANLLFAQTQTTPHEQYIQKYKNIAVLEMKRSGVPASIKLAQGLLESQFGQSELAMHANNHFGIKCKSTWQGETYSLEDDDFEDGVLIKSCFRKYSNVLASYKDHTDFLKSRSWYEPLFELNIRDYRSWAYGLKEAGYATDPLYPEKLISRIEQWKLNHFDNELPLDPIRELPGATIPLPAQTINSVNGLRMVLARLGQTPFTISKLTGIGISDLLLFNEEITNPNQILRKGEYVFLQRKESKYKRSKLYHTSNGIEDLYQISQRYGVTLERLAERNRMAPNAVPLKREQVKLRGWRVKKSKAPKWSFKVEVPPTTRGQVTDDIIYHTVLQGETLYSISRKYRTTPARIKTLNNLSTDYLRIDQILKIQ